MQQEWGTRGCLVFIYAYGLLLIILTHTLLTEKILHDKETSYRRLINISLSSGNKKSRTKVTNSTCHVIELSIYPFPTYPSSHPSTTLSSIIHHQFLFSSIFIFLVTGNIIFILNSVVCFQLLLFPHLPTFLNQFLPSSQNNLLKIKSNVCQSLFKGVLQHSTVTRI